MVEDIEAAFRHFEAHKVKFERGWLPDQKSFLVRDPDGLVLEVIEADADRK